MVLFLKLTPPLRITAEANIVEDDKEYQVYFTLKIRIDDAVAQSPRKSQQITPTTTTNITTTTCLTAVFEVNNGLEEYVVFDNADDAIEVKK